MRIRLILKTFLFITVLLVCTACKTCFTCDCYKSGQHFLEERCHFSSDKAYDARQYSTSLMYNKGYDQCLCRY